MMNQEFKAKWLEALRSGRYKQTTGALRRGNQYCCLGVACDISGLGRWQGDGLYLGLSGVLPLEVERMAGLESSDGDPLIEGVSLSQRNDRGATFEEIADLIEEHL